MKTELSQRQAAMLGHLSNGATDKEIARAMGVSPSTIYTQMSRIMEKLGASNRTHAVSLAYRIGYLQVQEAA